MSEIDCRDKSWPKPVVMPKQVLALVKEDHFTFKEKGRAVSNRVEIAQSFLITDCLFRP